MCRYNLHFIVISFKKIKIKIKNKKFVLLYGIVVLFSRFLGGELNEEKEVK